MTERYDVVVIGAGPIGTLYASMLKQQRPQTRVLIVDRATELGHKIGESTLSGFCKALRTVGVSADAMRQLFYPKNGLGFSHVDRSTRPLTDAPEYILESFDETYQVERRVLDTLLLLNARRLGIDVRLAAAVDLERSSFGAAGNRLAFKDGREVVCSLVVDATGPAGFLSRHFGLHRADASPFQTSAVWTYYEGTRPLASYAWPKRAQSPRDHYTEHLCFHEGWLWHIPLVSWQSTPTPVLERVLSRTLDPDPPSRADLVRNWGATCQSIVSIGLVLRSDRDTALARDPEATFEEYRRSYPAIAELLHGARRLSDHYGRRRTFHSRAAFRGYSARAAGDGWLLIGDAAFFVDPLISPGLTGGVAGAFRAVASTRRLLDSGGTDRDALTSYDDFVRQLHGALERDNQLVYMSFDHPEALALVQRFQETFARRHFLDQRDQPYGDTDTNVWGILDPLYQDVQVRAWALMREEEDAVARRTPAARQSAADYTRMVARLRRVLAPHIDDALTPYVGANAPDACKRRISC
jgi:flavin-dependent dehydrogenase